MKGKLLLGVGLAIGYVIGARAGRESYEEIKANAEALWNDPRLRDKVAVAEQKVREHAPEVPGKIAEAASAVKAKIGNGHGESTEPHHPGLATPS